MVDSRMSAICRRNLSRGFRPGATGSCRLCEAPVPCSDT